MKDSVKQRRQSRGKAAKSYRVEEEYSFLDSEGEETAQQTKSKKRHVPRSEDEDDDSDTFMPDEQDDDPEDAYMIDADEDELDDVGTPAGSSRAGSDDVESEADSRSPSGKRRKSAKCRVGSVSTKAAAGLYQGRRSVATPRPKAAASPKSKPQPVQKRETRKPEQKINRGVDEWGRGVRGGGLENRVKDLFGPAKEDLEPILKTKEFWLHQFTLPNRKESLRRSFYVNDEAREREVKKLREWYAGPGQEGFARGQQYEALDESEGREYLANDGPSSINLLMGVVTSPELYRLNKGACLSTAAPFEKKENRRGWVFNMGAKIRDAQWAPVDEGWTQYLAVAVEQKQHGIPPLANPSAPAFSATDPYPSSIQIWAFEATQDGDDESGGKLLDPTKTPRLDLVVCTEWGAPKQLRWCPFAVSTPSESEDGKTIRLGLLASIWSDGKIRILDISYPKPHLSKPLTRYHLYTHSAISISFPNTVPSTIHWLSSTSLAVGTAAGIIGLWTLTRPDTFPPPDHNLKTPYTPRPWFYRQLADTFILSLASGYPSRPTYISLSTADGYSKLIDLRSPFADTASTNRGRIFGLCQAWHDATQSFLMPDEIQLLRSNTIRRYYSNIHNMRSEAQIVCCATSPVHPGVLVGSADGVVSASNPLSRILNYKEIPWAQIWFGHEWRPAVDKLLVQPKGQRQGQGLEIASELGGDEATEMDMGTEGSDREDQEPPPSTLHSLTGSGNTDSEPHGSNVPPEALAQPLSRFTEGYKVQQTALQPVKPGTNPHSKDFIKPISIHEEPTTITTVAWNPNLRFGTWAVAGMGDGLLRVEDLGI